MSGLIFYVKSTVSIFTNQNFKGWGRKKTGRFSLRCNKVFGGKLTLLEDGFIRSINLGGSESFSIVEDDIGIYYDATVPSKLENLLNTYDFKSNSDLLKKSTFAIDLIKKSQVSKYNHAPNIDDDYFSNATSNKVLIITQTKGDLSLCIRIKIQRHYRLQTKNG